MPSMERKYPWRRVFSSTPRAASITMSAASAREAPVTMFLRNSMWPGASMMMYRRLSDLKKQRAVSIVMP